MNIILPECLNLLAVNKIYTLHYLPMINKIKKINKHTPEREQISLQENFQDQLWIMGKISNKLWVKKALLKFLRHEGNKILLPWLKQLSEKTGLEYRQAKVRHASTRWGSCSAKKHISLNAKLLFLPAVLVEHVLLHELCHTLQMNHSRRFWNLLKSFNPDCLALRQQLKQASLAMPAWLT